MSKVLKAAGPSVAVIRFDADRIGALRTEEVKHIAYHVARLLGGQGTAVMEWEHFGMTVELEPDTDQGDE